MASYINLTSFWGRGEIFWRPRRIMFPGYKLPIDSALGLPLLSKLWKIKWLKQVVVAFWWMQGWVRSGVRPFSFPDLDKFLFSHSVRSDSLQLHGLQHTRLHYSPLSLGICSNSCPLSRCCYPTISSSAIYFSFYLRPFPPSRSFPGSQLFASGGQSIGISASASVLPVNAQGWFPLGLTGLISLLSKGFLRVFSSTTILKHQFFSTGPSLCSNSHIITGNTKALNIWIFVGKVMSLLFNMLCRFVTALLPGSRHFLISWLQSPSSVILEPKKIKSATASMFSSVFQEVMGLDAMIFVFLMLSFKSVFRLYFQMWA